MKRIISVLLLAIIFSCKDDDDVTTYDKNNELIGVWEFLDSRTIWININAKDTLSSYKDTTSYKDSTGAVFPPHGGTFIPVNDLLAPNDLTLKKNKNYIIKAHGLSLNISSPGTYTIEKNKLKFVSKTGYRFESYYKIKNANQMELFSNERYFKSIQGETYYLCFVTKYDRKQ